MIFRRSLSKVIDLVYSKGKLGGIFNHMFVRRRRLAQADIWAGFVDALSTLLMVIIFVLMTFILSQFYMSDVLQTKDSTVKALTEKLKHINILLAKEQDGHESAKKQIDSYRTTLANVENNMGKLRSELSQARQAAELDDTKSLPEHLHDLKKQIFQLSQTLEQEQRLTDSQTQSMEELKQNMDAALLEKEEKLKVLTSQIEEQQQENQSLQKEISEHKDKSSIVQYRSEFFAHLKNAIGDRQDMKIVGDRFIFQSEVLFDRGSADLEKSGKEQLLQLSKALKEIASKIPEKVNWILRIDGHTDIVPIKTAQFASNWELSSARAIAVVKFLEQQGISPDRLVAAGFGEHQPIVKDAREENINRNRRIEFKLDQR